MNGYDPARHPKCCNCGEPLPFADSNHVQAFRAGDGRIYCNEFCCEVAEGLETHPRQ